MNSRKMITTLALVLAVVLSSVPGFGATWTPISLGSEQTHDAVFSVAGNSFGGGFDTDWKLVGPTSSSEFTGGLIVSGNDISGSSDTSLYLAHDYSVGDAYAWGPVALILGEYATDFSFTTGNIQGSNVPLTVTFYDTATKNPTPPAWILTLNAGGGAYQTFSTAAAGLNFGLFNAVLFTQPGSSPVDLDPSGLEFGQMKYVKAVPLPATVWLLGSVLGGLIMVRRRR